MDWVFQRSWSTLWNEPAKRPLFQDLDLFVTGPLLGQHDVSYQRGERWLNLEERTMFQLWVPLSKISVIKSRRWVSGRLFFIWEISSAMMFSSVLIHCELMPRGKFINSEQKKQASKQLSLEHLHLWTVQFDAKLLSVMLRRAGWGLSMTGFVLRTWSVAQ